MGDSSVFSVQSCLFPAGIAAKLTTSALLEHYLRHIQRCTAGMIRPNVAEDAIEFRLLGSRLSLISFLPPHADGNALVLPISGGLLVRQRRERQGELRFVAEPDGIGIRVALRLSGFHPMLLGAPPPTFCHYWLYRLSQAYIHRLVTIGFLARLHRELAGDCPVVRIMPLKEREGRPV